jgi:aminopeptidase C
MFYFLRSLPFFLVSLLAALQVLAANYSIPVMKCSTLMSAVEQNITEKNKKVLEHLANKYSSLNSGYEIASFMKEAVEAKVRTETAINMLVETPYVKKMNFPREELESAFQEIFQTHKLRDLNFEIVSAKVIKNLSVYREGKKTYTSERPYDSVLEILGVKNQCRLGSCWAYASMTTVELAMKHFRTLADVFPEKFGHMKELTDEQLRLATEHFYALYVINEVKKLVKSGRFDAKEEIFQQGGWFKNFMAFAMNFGTGVPEAQWAPFKSYKKAMFKDQFLDGLKAIAARHHEILQEIRNSEATSKEKAKRIEEETKLAFNEIEASVESYTKDLDSSLIQVKGKSFSPREFHERYLGSMVEGLDFWNISHVTETNVYTNSARVSIIDVNKSSRLKEEYFSYPTTMNYVREADFEKVIRNSIDKGLSVYISINVPVNRYTDPKTGKSYEVINGQNGLTTQEFAPNTKLKSRGGHAVVVVGYELDAKGKIATLLIQNSWGTEHGDKGLLHFDISFVKNNLRQAVTFKIPDFNPLHD